ncbi:MAG TPA: phosphopantetheine-binding protein [Myxococcota bacterium]|nr:phosphopantetheine-binding protein [Myxococcota bacterium]
MTREQILERIRRVARERLEMSSSFDLQTNLLRDLQLDSLKQLSLVVELENEFEICFEPEEEEALETVGHVVDLVQRLLLAGAEPIRD